MDNQIIPHINVQPCGTADECMNEGVKHLNQALISAVKAGYYFVEAKRLKEEEGIKFGEYVSENNLSWQRVCECMQLFRIFANAPADQQKKMLSVGKTKILLLASLEEDALQSLDEEGWQEIEATPVKLLKAKFKREREVLEGALQEVRKNTFTDKQLKLRDQHGFDGFGKVRKLTEISREWDYSARLSIDEAIFSAAQIGDEQERTEALGYIVLALTASFERLRTTLEDTYEMLGRRVPPELLSQLVIDEQVARSLVIDRAVIYKEANRRWDHELMNSEAIRTRADKAEKRKKP